MAEMMNLDMEDLEKVAGGQWSPSTLTPEEFDEYKQLRKAYDDSFKYGNKSPEHDEALANFNAFFDRMNEKYGGPEFRG